MLCNYEDWNLDMFIRSLYMDASLLFLFVSFGSRIISMFILLGKQKSRVPFKLVCLLCKDFDK